MTFYISKKVFGGEGKQEIFNDGWWLGREKVVLGMLKQGVVGGRSSLQRKNIQKNTLF